MQKFLDTARQYAPEFVEIRKKIHAQPELGFAEHKTAALVAAKLREFGYELHEGIAHTGIVALLKKGTSARTIAFRADMDALPMSEHSGCEYASAEAGRMHACGHDGHTATLLCAAKIIAEMDFDGTAMLVFQPSEEACDESGETGAMKMVREGVFERFKADWIFGYHNMPAMQMAGRSAVVYARAGAFMAGTSRYSLKFIGRGGHASAPHLCADPIAAAASFISALYAFKSNYLSALSGAVLNVTAVNADAGAFNIVPDAAALGVNMRALDAEQMRYMQERLEAIARGVAAGFGIECEIKLHESLMPTVNEPRAQEFLAATARELFGAEAVDTTHEPLMGSEDFGYLAQAAGSGCYCFLSNGPSANLHSGKYIFDDENIIRGAALWAAMTAKYLGAGEGSSGEGRA